MATVVEDGTIVTNANSYVSEADLITYAAARGVTILAPAAEELIVKSMDYIEAQAYKGIKFTQDQELQWPRANVYVDAYLVSTTEIPDELIKGQNETALSISNGEDPLADIARVQDSVKVGSIAVTYSSGSSSTTTVRKISSALRKLLRSAGGIAFEVKR